MTDQQYTQMMQDALNQDTLKTALEMLTKLHQECDRRSMEYWSGKRTSRSIKSRQFVNTVNAVRAKFNVWATYTKANRYEVKA